MITQSLIRLSYPTNKKIKSKQTIYNYRNNNANETEGS